MTDGRRNRIAFGSCNHQDRQNNLWDLVSSRDPAAFIWGGDAVYADKVGPYDFSTFPPKRPIVCGDPLHLRRLYAKQLRNPGYQRLLENNVTIFGTFDDHDYGCNNADRRFPHKYGSSLAFTDFISAPNSMRRRAREGEGVYGVKLFDFSRPKGHFEVPEVEAMIDADLATGLPPVSFSNKTVAVFVLDVRTHKTPWKHGSEKYKLDYEGDFLGETQWQWFQKSIKRSRAAVNVIVNGLQVHASRFPDGNVAESWSRYPVAQQRLFDTILADGVESAVLISGDVHMTQLMRKDCMKRGGRDSRSIVEMTTSGMTHSWGTLPYPIDDSSYRHSWIEKYQSFVAKQMMRMLHFACPWTDVLHGDGVNLEYGGGQGARVKGRQFSLLKNFGELEFDWDERTIKLQTFGEEQEGGTNTPLLMAQYSMGQLSGRQHIPAKSLTKDNFLQKETSFNREGLAGEWVCINNRGIDSGIAHIFGHFLSGTATAVLVSLPLCVLIFLARLFGKRRKNSSVYDTVPSASKL